MKRLLLICGLLFGIHSYAATTPTSVETYTKDFMAQLEKNISLSDDQKEAMIDALTNNISDREDILQTYKGQSGLKVKKEIKKELEAVNANLQSEAQEILTPEQYSKFLEVQGKNQAAVRERVQENY